MANPSDTGTSGVGTEVLRRSHTSALTTSSVKLIDGDANHIYTVISVTFTNIATSSEELTMKINTAEGTEVQLLREFPLGGKQMFVWNDKFVLTDTDELVVETESGSSDIDVLCSYIDQEWTT